jgi:hypothetical protein
MNDSQITEMISQAKDQFGVITSDSAHSQLGSFSETDWQQASKLFAPDPAKPDAFSIVDKGGNVSIHNDISEANKIGNTSVSDLTGADADTVITDAIAVAAAGVVGVGVAAGLGNTSALGVSLLGGAAEASAFGAAAAATLIACEAIIAGSGLFLAGDAVRNTIRQREAEHDVSNNSVINLQAPTPATV